jgi:hypothetical protein
MASRRLVQLDSEARNPASSIIGGDSFIKTAGELRDICQLPSSPDVVETTTCSIMPLRNEKQREVHTVHIADVEWPQWYHLQQRTEGKMTCVWFRGKRSLAWLAWGPKADEANPDDAKAGETTAEEPKADEAKAEE